jgi:hypothetical protein
LRKHGLGRADGVRTGGWGHVLTIDMLRGARVPLSRVNT